MHRAQPSLVAEPPLEPAVYWLTASPFTIGRAREAGVRIDHPLVEPRHAVLVEREDGWWITSARPSTLINGVPIAGGSQLLSTGDHIQLAGGATLTFSDGQPAPVSQAAAPGWAPIKGRRKRRWRPSITWPSGRALLIGAVLILVIAAGVFGWQRWNRKPAADPNSQDLTVAEALTFDSLLSVAFDHIERGNILLEVDARQSALDEFAEGLVTISGSSLHNRAYVKQRLNELRASIREVYTSHQMAVPSSVAGNTSVRALAGQGLKAALSVPQFSAAIDVLRSEFSLKYGMPLEITGRDHPEHLSLYGPASAVDVRTKTLSSAQVQYVIDAAHRTGIRVKDFSQDAVLKAQVQAAVRAGRADVAGTGLHMHLDRFANRNDRWTVPAGSAAQPTK